MCMKVTDDGEVDQQWQPSFPGTSRASLTMAAKSFTDDGSQLYSLRRAHYGSHFTFFAMTKCKEGFPDTIFATMPR